MQTSMFSTQTIQPVESLATTATVGRHPAGAPRSVDRRPIPSLLEAASSYKAIPTWDSYRPSDTPTETEKEMMQFLRETDVPQIAKKLGHKDRNHVGHHQHLQSLHPHPHNHPHPHLHHHPHHHHHHHHQMLIETVHEPSRIMMEESLPENYRAAKNRIQEVIDGNSKNEQIILFFTSSRDKHGKIWNNDCIMVEKAMAFMIKKIRAGGHLLKIHVGDRNAWMNIDNPWKNDGSYRVQQIPTLLVVNTMKRLNGTRGFDLQALYTLLKD